MGGVLLFISSCCGLCSSGLCAMSEELAASDAETEASKLAAYYSKLAEEKSVSPKLKEACLLYVEAEEQLEDQLVEEAIGKATKALEAFREAKNTFGQQDAVRLLCAGERALPTWSLLNPLYPFDVWM